MVIWLVGKSGAGKTEIGRRLYQRFKAVHPGTVFLDGDILREIMGKDLGYSPEDRHISEERTSRLCKLLSDQGLHVVCAKLSNSPPVRAWNRTHIPDYHEVYLRVPPHVLEQRDPKGLYAKFRKGEMRQMVGLDIPFHEPEGPTLVIDNLDRDPEQLAAEIFERLTANRSSTLT
ncbi:MAG: adenylyl-sulfate kinase [Lentisphaerae bacterium]|nr:adenylyl-sulfate kinase [Lentisphaerota bacterium]